MRRVPGRLSMGLLVSLTLAAGCKKSPPPPSPELVPAKPEPQAPEIPARCHAITDAPFVLGPTDRPAIDAGEPLRDDVLPFAAETGDGVAWSGGFALGALYENGPSLAFAVVTLDRDGRNAKVTALGAARGDVEPPRLAARDTLLAAAVVEPDVNGRSLRLAKIDNGAVSWGATLHERGGESRAFDLGLGEKKGIVVWDEDADTSTIQVSTFDTPALSNATPPRAISRANAEAESPRLAARPGGYWLAYIARAAGAGQPDGTYVPEDIGFRWIEIIPLDANGSPSGAARAVTPKDGHVLVFDFAPAPDGGAIVVYRSEETPTGSAGGEVMRVVAHPTGSEAPSVLVNEDVGAGVPNLLPGWLAVLDAADTTRLAPVGALGEVAGPLGPEPDIGAGEPVAAAGNRLLVARPAGRAVKLLVVECAAEARDR